METKTSLPAVELAELSHPGRDPEKQVNEDACAFAETPLGHLAVLCDGMGGHERGRDAANLAVQTIVEAFQASGPQDALVDPGARGRQLLGEAITLANRRVFELGAHAEHGRPGSTVVALLVHAAGAELAHVGDSRCYLLHGGQIFQTTKDHSMVQKMVDAALLTPAEAAVHPDANRILRALGSAPEVEVEVRAQTLAHAPGDAFVLCSDGLSDLVEQAKILEIAGSARAPQAVRDLVELANARGGHDNVTVMMVRIGDAALAPRSVRAPQTVAATVAQTVIEMPAIAPPMPASARPAVTLPGPPIAPVPAAAPRRFSVALALGVLLGLVGVGAAGFALYLLLNPAPSARQVAPFALTGLPFASARPPTTLIPVAPEAAAPPGAEDAGASPLPSLVPPPPPRAGRGR